MTIFTSQTYKLIVLGDSSVGKTSIINRYCCQQFEFSLTSTIGIDFKYKELEKRGGKVRLQIWDTAGQERYQNITKSYFKKADGVMFVFDLGDKKSFKNIQKWLKLLQNEVGEAVPKVLVGCKFDLFQERTVSTYEANLLSQKYAMPYIEVSSKLNFNISQAFDLLIEAILLEGIQYCGAEKKVDCRLFVLKNNVKGCGC